MSVRSWTLTLLATALLASLISLVAPWHQEAGAPEWDDGEHVWGRNIHDTSIFVTGLDDDVAQDPDGLLLRQIGFWAFMGGLFFQAISYVFAIMDRKGWALGLGFTALVLLGAGAGGVVGGILYELNDVNELRPQAGLINAAVMIVFLLVGQILSFFLGKTPAAQARKAARMERKAAKKQARIEARAEARAEAGKARNDGPTA